MLKSIPTENHLARAYFELAKLGASCEGQQRPWPYSPKDVEELFCLACDMSRHDPRLFSILVRFLSEHWCDLNPQKIRSHYPAMQTPQTVAVIAEFLLGEMGSDDETRFFLEYLSLGLRPLPLQFYFHHLYPPAGNLAARAAKESLAEYKKWGFLAREAPVLDDSDRRPIGTLDAATRKNILMDLIKNKTRIKISDYINVLGHRISRQQALIDLRSIEGIRRVGKGRGTYWKQAA